MSSVGSVLGSQQGMLVTPTAPMACFGATGRHGLARVHVRGRGRARAGVCACEGSRAGVCACEGLWAGACACEGLWAGTGWHNQGYKS